MQSYEFRAAFDAEVKERTVHGINVIRSSLVFYRASPTFSGHLPQPFFPISKCGILASSFCCSINTSTMHLK